MTKTPEQIETRNDLDSRLSDILIRGTLYRPFVYTGDGLGFKATDSLTGTERYGLLPSALRMYCENKQCKAVQLWQLFETDSRFFFGWDMPTKVRYVCRNCGKQIINYWIDWTANDGVFTFIKAGQWPALTIEPSPVVAKALGAEDTSLYKKALINASISHGLGALAYFRRVIENKVNVLLDLVEEAAKTAQVHEDELKNIAEVKASKHVDVKIEYAARILPTHLRPGGHNPLERLYGVASAGLHGESDSDCVGLFQEYRAAFEYLIQNLTEQNEQAEAYVRQLSKIPKLQKASSTSKGIGTNQPNR
jgi:hypothetical protein